MVKWLIDTSILEGRLNNQLPAEARRQGHEVFEVQFFKGVELPEIPFSSDDCVVVYGSHQFNRAVGIGRFRPGSLGLNDRTNTLNYMSNLPVEWFLNRNGVHTTWALFKHNTDFWFNIFETQKLFIRPNSGFKTFTGQVIEQNDLWVEMNALDKLSSVVGETQIMVAPTREILGEFRFVVADREVVTGSEYRWDNKLDIRIDYPPECWELANQVSKHDWQVDLAYTCDVALTPEGPRVVELNSFSCAGLYACDLERVVEGISAVALKEHQGLVSL